MENIEPINLLDELISTIYVVSLVFSFILLYYRLHLNFPNAQNKQQYDRCKRKVKSPSAHYR
jgi:hypothetical protein